MTSPFLPDPVLGGALGALDVRTMGPILQEKILDEEGAIRRWDLERCEIDRAHYRPHKKLRVSYRLSVRDTSSDAVRSHLVTSRVYPTGRGAAAYEKASRRGPVEVEIGRPISLVPELDVVLWSFPSDGKLANLHRLFDETWVRDEGLASIDGLGGADQLRIEPVRYRPERTCTVRVKISSPDNGHPRTVYGKLYHDELGGATFDVMRQLWHSDQRRNGLLVLAEPLGFVSRDRVLWQAALPGSTLGASSPWDQDFVGHLRLAAQALASFHATATVGPPLSTRQDWLRRAERTLQRLARVDAPVTPGCADVVERLRESSGQIHGEPVVTLHGDPHLRNILRVGTRVGLIDLDEVQRGSPSQDLGCFAAALLKSGLNHGRSTDDAFRLIAIFLDEYQHYAPWPLDLETVAWYTAASLIANRLLRAFKTRTMDFGGLGPVVALAGGLVPDGGQGHMTDVLDHSAGRRGRSVL